LLGPSSGTPDVHIAVRQQAGLTSRRRGDDPRKRHRQRDQPMVTTAMTATAY
jgi:hypothetical protein